MDKKTRKISAVVALVLVYLLIGSLMVRTGHLAQPVIQSLGIHSATNAASAHTVSANSPLERHQKTNRGVAPAGANSLAMSSKGGGGTVAVFTFLMLFSLWLIRGWWITGMALPHRPASATLDERS